jgi:hypothetical protein
VKKNLLFVLLLFFFAAVTPAMAQRRNKKVSNADNAYLSIGPSYLNLGGLGLFGINGAYTSGRGNAYAVGLGTGYYSKKEMQTLGTVNIEVARTVIPAQLEVRYYFSSQAFNGFYVKADVGGHVLIESADKPLIYTRGSAIYYGGGGGAGYTLFSTGALTGNISGDLGYFSGAGNQLRWNVGASILVRL